jgi:hypothetical protein
VLFDQLVVIMQSVSAITCASIAAKVGNAPLVLRSNSLASDVLEASLWRCAFRVELSVEFTPLAPLTLHEGHEPCARDASCGLGLNNPNSHLVPYEPWRRAANRVAAAMDRTY